MNKIWWVKLVPFARMLMHLVLGGLTAAALLVLGSLKTLALGLILWGAVEGYRRIKSKAECRRMESGSSGSSAGACPDNAIDL